MSTLNNKAIPLLYVVWARPRYIKIKGFARETKKRRWVGIGGLSADRQALLRHVMPRHDMSSRNTHTIKEMCKCVMLRHPMS